MTISDRQEMFSKDYLTIEDIEKLLGFSYGRAADYIRTIKRALTFPESKKYNENGLRLDVQGKIHVQDYLDYIGVKSDRYTVNEMNKMWGVEANAEVSSNR